MNVGETMLSRTTAILVLLALTVVLAPLSARAQDGPDQQNIEAMWRDMLEFIETANVDAARSYAQAIIDRNPDPRELYDLSRQVRDSMTVIGRGSNLEGLKPLLDQLLDLIEQGYVKVRKDADEIRAAVDRLDKGMEAYALALDRLKESGEYAVPHLVTALMDEDTSSYKRQLILNVLVAIGKEAVRPISEGLQTEDPKLQEMFADVLRRIEYPHAVPRLKELAARKDLLPRTREVVERALFVCGGKEAMTKTVAALCYEWAGKYYERAESLRPDPRSRTAIVWFWRQNLGLVPSEVPNPIFCDVYAMRLARMALEHDPKYYPAVPLWIMAGLNREATLPAGEQDPLRGANEPGADFYALASSPRYLRTVVDLALEDMNTPVALAAIKALVETQGTRSLGRPEAGGVQPLVEALTYPDREVRFFSAVSLANALPPQPFEGHELVVKVLNSALRQEGKRVAMVISSDVQQTNLLKDMLRDLDYRVVEGADASKAMAAAADVSGVDVIVHGIRPDPSTSLAAIRTQPFYTTTPVVLANTTPGTRRLAERGARVFVTDPEPDLARFRGVLDQAISTTVGRALEPDEAEQWAVKAAEAIEKLGVAGNRVCPLVHARGALIAALDDDRSAIRIAAAEALATMEADRAQRAIASLANRDDVDEAIRVAAYEALTASLKRHGTMLADAHVDDVTKVVTGPGTQTLRVAAARALGAMNLPSQEIIPLIQSAGARR